MTRGRIDPDLIALNLLTLLLIVLAAISSTSWPRMLLGFLFVFLFPGYVVVAAIFPGQQGLGAVPRMALSLGLSIPIVVFIGLILEHTPWRIETSSVLLSVSTFILVTSGIAWCARRRMSSDDRFRVNVRLHLASVTSTWRTSEKALRLLIIILLCAILAGGGALSYVLANPATKDGAFIEFYLLGAEGGAENYPRQLSQGEEGKVIVGIVNHGNDETEYHLEVRLEGVTLYQVSSIQLESHEKWEEVIGFALRDVGDSQKVEFVLCKENGQPHGIRYLWIDVSA